jgi:hypothetical protein
MQPHHTAVVESGAIGPRQRRTIGQRVHAHVVLAGVEVTSVGADGESALRADDRRRHQLAVDEHVDEQIVVTGQRGDQFGIRLSIGGVGGG